MKQGYANNIALFRIMTQQPLKILLCNEASFLSTGYAVYGKELLARLSKNPAFHVAELACYGMVNDPRDRDITWRYYANCVKNTDPRFGEYSASPENAFGRWRFEKTLIDFEPDVVIDIRDYWMNCYQAYSPLRKCFHWMVMPTVDSYPQQEAWLDTYLGADSIFTYSDWAEQVLKLQTNGHINHIDTASPGIDATTYSLIDSSIAKKALQIDENKIVFGSVMRNQKRKLIPELIKATRQLIDKLASENSPFADKVYLYLHTGYPDYLGWDIPTLLKDNRMLNRTLLTYLCQNCKKVFADVYSGSHRNCIYCKNKSASLPSVTSGVTLDQMVNIYNAFDMYIQYSICEGFGMPQVEAAACGVPVTTIPYSAMEDIVSKLNATPVQIATLFKELETQAYRAYPDNNSLVEIMHNFLYIPYPIKYRNRITTRNNCIDHYSWNHIIVKWEKRLLELYQQKQQTAHTNKYDEIKKIQPKPYLTPEIVQSLGESDIQKLDRICSQFLNGAHHINSYFILNMLEKLTLGFEMGNQKISNYSWSDAIAYFNTVIKNNNTLIAFYSNKQKLNDDFIEYAHIKDPRHE